MFSTVMGCFPRTCLIQTTRSANGSRRPLRIDTVFSISKSFFIMVFKFFEDYALDSVTVFVKYCTVVTTLDQLYNVIKCCEVKLEMYIIILMYHSPSNTLHVLALII